MLTIKVVAQPRLPGNVWLARLGMLMPIMTIKSLVRRLFLCTASYILLRQYVVKINMPQDRKR